MRSRGWQLLAGVAFATTRYDEAATAARQWLALSPARGSPKNANDAKNTLDIATALAALPGQDLLTCQPQAVPTARDKAGLLRTSVKLNGSAVSAVLDTGANLSVISESQAARLGVIIGRGAQRVGSSTDSAAVVRTGYARELVIGNRRIENVAFLVMDDSALEIPLPGGYRIEATLGFPVFKALSPVSFASTGATGLRASGIKRGARNLYFTGSDIYVRTRIGGADTTLHLDSGASHTALSSEFADRFPQVVATGKERTVGRAGVAGTQVDRVRQLLLVPAVIDGHEVILDEIDASLPSADSRPSDTVGTIGQSLLTKFRRYTLDFGQLRFAADPL